MAIEQQICGDFQPLCVEEFLSDDDINKFHENTSPGIVFFELGKATLNTPYAHSNTNRTSIWRAQ